MEGFLHKGAFSKGVLKWKKRYFRRSESALTIYKDAAAMAQELALGQCTVDEKTVLSLGRSHQFSFAVSNPGKSDLLAAATSAEEFEQWLRSISAPICIKDKKEMGSFEGLVFRRSKSKEKGYVWKKRWMCLIDGSLKLFKSQSDKEGDPIGEVKLDGTFLHVNADSDHTFAIQSGEKAAFVGRLTSSSDLAGWLSSLCSFYDTAGDNSSTAVPELVLTTARPVVTPQTITANSATAPEVRPSPTVESSPPSRSLVRQGSSQVSLINVVPPPQKSPPRLAASVMFAETNETRSINLLEYRRQNKLVADLLVDVARMFGIGNPVGYLFLTPKGDPMTMDKYIRDFDLTDGETIIFTSAENCARFQAKMRDGGQIVDENTLTVKKPIVKIEFPEQRSSKAIDLTKYTNQTVQHLLYDLSVKFGVEKSQRMFKLVRSDGHVLAVDKQVFDCRLRPGELLTFEDSGLIDTSPVPVTKPPPTSETSFEYLVRSLSSKKVIIKVNYAEGRIQKAVDLSKYMHKHVCDLVQDLSNKFGVEGNPKDYALQRSNTAFLSNGSEVLACGLESGEMLSFLKAMDRVSSPTPMLLGSPMVSGVVKVECVERQSQRPIDFNKFSQQAMSVKDVIVQVAPKFGIVEEASEFGFQEVGTGEFLDENAGIADYLFHGPPKFLLCRKIPQVLVRIEFVDRQTYKHVDISKYMNSSVTSFVYDIGKSFGVTAPEQYYLKKKGKNEAISGDLVSNCGLNARDRLIFARSKTSIVSKSDNSNPIQVSPSAKKAFGGSPPMPDGPPSPDVEEEIDGNSHPVLPALPRIKALPDLPSEVSIIKTVASEESNEKSDIRMEGILFSGAMNSDGALCWDPKYFKLRGDNLNSYADVLSENPEMDISIGTKQSRLVSEEVGIGTEFTFSLTTSEGNSLLLRAEDAATMDIWMKSLKGISIFPMVDSKESKMDIVVEEKQNSSVPSSKLEIQEENLPPQKQKEEIEEKQKEKIEEKKVVDSLSPGKVAAELEESKKPVEVVVKEKMVLSPGKVAAELEESKKPVEVVVKEKMVEAPAVKPVVEGEKETDSHVSATNNRLAALKKKKDDLNKRREALEARKKGLSGPPVRRKPGPVMHKPTTVAVKHNKPPTKAIPPLQPLVIDPGKKDGQEEEEKMDNPAAKETQRRTPSRRRPPPASVKPESTPRRAPPKPVVESSDSESDDDSDEEVDFMPKRNVGLNADMKSEEVKIESKAKSGSEEKAENDDGLNKEAENDISSVVLPEPIKETAEEIIEQVPVNNESKQLPAGWERIMDESSGNYYYVNRNEQCSSWTHPDEIQNNAEEKPAKQGGAGLSALLSKNKLFMQMRITNDIENGDIQYGDEPVQEVLPAAPTIDSIAGLQRKLQLDSLGKGPPSQQAPSTAQAQKLQHTTLARAKGPTQRRSKSRRT